jgi:ATPase, P-type (transporting), HAD superfamily, subfamily IC
MEDSMTEQKDWIRKGLTSQEARKLQEQFGKNEINSGKQEGFLRKVLHIIEEPMFLLLLVAAVIYFILGEPRDGIIMLVFVIVVISIDVIQEWKTDRTIKALKELSEPHITVIRDGKEQDIVNSDLVPGDLMLISEGIKIPADGQIIKASDLCVDESTLTGEAQGVWKSVGGKDLEISEHSYWRNDYCYSGTLVTQGNAIIQVDKIGLSTEYGKIGKDIALAPQIVTPLQKQTGGLVKVCTIIAGVLFLLVSILTYFNLPDHSFGARMIESILSGITLAMAMIPEEFPVVLTVFLSMGAWRLAKKHSLVRKLPSVETLGSVSVLCVDKTGTITKNNMTVVETWPYETDQETLCEVMGLGCEVDAYDPMEKAMLDYCEKNGITKEHLFAGELLMEYAFTNELKMMGHIWNHDEHILIAAKGSPEHILDLCQMSGEEKALLEERIKEMSRKGLRVIGIASMLLESSLEIPPSLTDCDLNFCGLIV